MKRTVAVRTICYGAGIAMLALSIPTYANDSEMAVGVGGLTFKHNAAISMDSEDLFISPEQVVVKYRFTNRSKAAVQTQVAFPMPLIALDDVTEREGGWHDWADFYFTTHVNGTPIELTRHNRALKDGRDVTARLDRLNLPYHSKDGIGAALDALSAAEQDQLISEGLVQRTRTNEGNSFRTLWKVQTNFVREQVFPAGQTISVEHRYRPLVGGSIAGGLEPGARKGKEGTAKYYRDTYCTNADFISGFDRIHAARKKADPELLTHTEQWLQYILKTGANWQGPIRDFRLVVDKGDPRSLVSFCMDGVRKISPTRFEVRKTNYEPTRDLDIVIVKWNDAR